MERDPGLVSLLQLLHKDQVSGHPFRGFSFLEKESVEAVCEDVVKKDAILIVRDFHRIFVILTLLCQFQCSRFHMRSQASGTFSLEWEHNGKEWLEN